MADLTTLADVKEYLGEDISETAPDALLSRLITSESARFERLCGRTFGAASTTDIFNGDGGTEYVLEVAPVASVASVTVDGVTIPARTVVGGGGWVLGGSTVYLVGYYFSEGVQNCTIVYSAGYAVPGDVAQAVVELVALAYRYKERIGIMSTSAGGEAVQYQTLTLPESVQSVIDSHYAWGVG